MDSQTEDSDIPLVLSHPLYRVNEDAFSRIDMSIRAFLRLADLEVCYRLTTLDEIHDLNRQFRSKDQPTDVLAFPQLSWQTPYDPAVHADWRDCMSSDPTTSLGSPRYDSPHFGPPQLGDVVVCLERAAEQAEALGHGLGREVVFLIIHGMLHLCGHDHHSPDEERVMIDLQRRVLHDLEEKGMQPLWQQCFQSKGAC